MSPRMNLPPSLIEELVSYLPEVPEARSLVEALVGDEGGMGAVGVDRRRLAVSADSYDALVEPVSKAVDAVLGAHPDAEELRAHMVSGLARMGDAAREADLAGVPPASAMEVIGVLPLFDDTGIAYWSVYLSSSVPVEYEAGQTFPVLRPEIATAARAEGVDPLWDTLAPAIPPNDFGELVFFLPAEALTSGVDNAQIPQVGDYWTLGHASGEPVWLSCTVDARGSALAGVRAAVFAAAERGAGVNVELLVDAAGSHEPGLRALADASHWLRLTQAD